MLSLGAFSVRSFVRQSQPKDCAEHRTRGNGQMQQQADAQAQQTHKVVLWLLIPVLNAFPATGKSLTPLYSSADVPWPGSPCCPSSKVSIPPHQHIAFLDFFKMSVFFFMQSVKWDGCASAYSLRFTSVCI